MCVKKSKMAASKMAACGQKWHISITTQPRRVRVNLQQGHGALFQAHNLSLHHLHDLPNESVSAGCQKDVCMGLHLTYSVSCTFTPSPVIPPVTRPLNGESGELRWPHDWFGTDLIQVCSVAFHTFLGRILVLFSCRAWLVCELLHCKCCTLVLRVLTWFKRLSAFQTFRCRASYHYSDAQLPGQCRLDYNIWGYACSQLVDTIDNLLTPFECSEYTWMLTRSGLIYRTYRST